MDEKTKRWRSMKKRRIAVDEQISLFQEPGSNYLGHCTTSCGTLKSLQQSIVAYCTENNKILDSLQVLGCDGTVVTTGYKGGVIRLMELHLRRPLQWLVCLLYANELPFDICLSTWMELLEVPNPFRAQLENHWRTAKTCLLSTLSLSVIM